MELESVKGVSRLNRTPVWMEILTDDELRYATEEWLKGQSELFYFTGIRKLRDRNKLHIDKGSDHVEK